MEIEGVPAAPVIEYVSEILPLRENLTEYQLETRDKIIVMNMHNMMLQLFENGLTV